MAAARLLKPLSIAAVLFSLAATAYADRLALWYIVHDQCVTDLVTNGKPAPCQWVRLDGGDRGDAVLKDLRGATQFLLIPTSRVTGIEDPAVLAPDAPNYFADAWRAIGVVSERAHVELARDDLSLAINAATARSQDQLHIHMDCVRADVRDALHRLAASVGSTWTPLAERLAGHRYRALRIERDGLDAVNPFRLLMDDLQGAGDEMGRHTLVVVGMTFANGAPGFILLDGRADLLHGGFGHGESLQDHDCAIAHQ